MSSPLDLPRHPVVHGHPIHAVLSDLPAALIPMAFLAEVSQRWLGERRDDRLPEAATAAALTSATVAGLVGWIDWLTMPTEHPAQKTATVHGLLNTGGILALIGAAMRPRSRLPFLGVATVAVVVAGWLGGDLVFRHGWRVRPVEEAEIVEKRLAEAGIKGYFEEARREVSDFERKKTFLGQ